MVILYFENNINNKTKSMKWKILAYLSLVNRSLIINTLVVIIRKYNEKS